jgi:membrane protein
VVHWTVAVGFTVFAVEVLYFIAPNVKQRFLATLPGAILSVTFWIGLSYLLGLYFRHFADYNRTYGTLGGFIAFTTWFYWTSFFFIAGAELNAELAKGTKAGPLRQKDKTLLTPHWTARHKKELMRCEFGGRLRTLCGICHRQRLLRLGREPH